MSDIYIGIDPGVTEVIKVTIYGKPISKKRPRFARRGKFVTTYNDQETEEGKFLFEAKSQIDKCILEGAIDIDCRFDMPRPKNHYGTGKNAGMLKQSAPTSHTKKPDLDNLLKFVFDCLNGLAWRDDSQINEIMASKAYSCEAKTIIQIRH